MPENMLHTISVELMRMKVILIHPHADCVATLQLMPYGMHVFRGTVYVHAADKIEADAIILRIVGKYFVWCRLHS